MTSPQNVRPWRLHSPRRQLIGVHLLDRHLLGRKLPRRLALAIAGAVLTALLPAAARGALAQAEPVTACASETARWQPVYGVGRNITFLASGPGFDAIFAGSLGEGGPPGAALWKGSLSTPTWLPVADFNGQRLTDAVVGPALANDPTRIWVSPFGDGPIVGSTTGESGTFRAKGSLDGWVMHFAASADKVFAAASKASAPHGIYAWNPQTAAWDKRNQTEIDTTFFRTMAASSLGESLWVGTEEKGPWRSTDAGVNWVPAGASDPTLGTTNIRSMATDPRDPSRAILGLGKPGNLANFNGQRGIRVVRDDSVEARHFTDVDLVSAVAYSKRLPSTAFAALYGIGIKVTNDNGRTWRTEPLPTIGEINDLTGESIYVLSLLTAVPEGNPNCELLFAGTRKGLYVRNVAKRVQRIYLPVSVKNVDAPWVAGE